MESVEEKLISIKDTDVIKELFQGRCLDIIMELMDNEVTEQQLLDRLDMYPIKLKYYLNKLISFGIVECIKEEVVKQKVKSQYKLKKENLELMVEMNDEFEENLNFISNVNTYINIMKNGFKVLSNNPKLTNKQGAVFIRTSLEEAEKFKQELNLLIDRFISIENKKADDGFLFLPMLFPYELKEDKNND